MTLHSVLDYWSPISFIMLVIVIFCQAVLNCLCTIKQNLPTFLGVFLSVIYLWFDRISPVHAMEACGGVGV
jgi:hypothetical protein